MSNCGEIQGLIAAALYGPLPAAEQARLQSHLAACENCRREQDELAQTAQMVGQSEVVDVQSDTFISAVRRKLGAKTHRRLPLKKAVVRRQAWVLPATVAAAVTLAAIGVYFLSAGPKPLQIEVAVQ